MRGIGARIEPREGFEVVGKMRLMVIATFQASSAQGVSTLAWRFLAIAWKRRIRHQSFGLIPTSSRKIDLIVAVFRTQVESCADAAAALSKKYGPEEALARWMQRYVDPIAKKRGLAAALHSGDPAYNALPGCFNNRLSPAFDTLLKAAMAEEVIRPDVQANDLLRAVATLCQGPHNEEPIYARKMVALLVDGLRYGARTRIESEAARS